MHLYDSSSIFPICKVIPPLRSNIFSTLDKNILHFMTSSIFPNCKVIPYLRSNIFSTLWHLIEFAKSLHACVVQSLGGNTLLPFYSSHVMHALFVQYKSLGWRNTSRNKIARIIFSLLGNKFNSWLNDSKISFKGSAFLYKTSFLKLSGCNNA